MKGGCTRRLGSESLFVFFFAFPFLVFFRDELKENIETDNLLLKQFFFPIFFRIALHNYP